MTIRDDAILTNFRHRWWPLPPRAVIALEIAAIVAIAAGFFALRGHESAPPAPRIAHAPPRIARVAAPKPASPEPVIVVAAPTMFDDEQKMTYGQMMKRWDPFMLEAAKRFGVPLTYIRAVMQAESGGRTMLGETQPIVSSAGAMGLMQLMPSTWADMRAQYRLGSDPFDPHDNIIAGTAYLRILRDKYGYPAMFAAYNDGPGNLEARMVDGGLLPAETRDYLATITGKLEGAGPTGHGNLKFTRPDGTPVWLDGGAVISVRAVFPGEYAPGIQAVINIGRVHQAVREPLARVRAIIRAHGGGV